MNVKSIRLNALSYTNSGFRLGYNYSVSAELEPYIDVYTPLFLEFSEDISNNPESINIIPFICNFLPIAWFLGFNLVVDEIDTDFYSCLKSIKQQFQNEWPSIELSGSLIVDRIVTNQVTGAKGKLLFFSGGVDGYASLIRHVCDDLELLTIWGADVPLDDQKQWPLVVNHIQSEDMTKNIKSNQIRSNLRDFYFSSLSGYINGSWWGQVQHGLALLGSAAPLAYKNGIKQLVIASSYTEAVNLAWGSSPFIDEKIKWAGTSVIHDGYELQRQDKVDLIAKTASTDNIIRIRVCYSELNDGLNCSQCEKCYRTIIGLILAGKDPNEFGFWVAADIYEKVFKYMNGCKTSIGMNYFWSEISKKANKAQAFYIFENREIETKYIARIAAGEIDNKLVSILNESKLQGYIRRFPYRIIGMLKRFTK